MLPLPDGHAPLERFDDLSSTVHRLGTVRMRRDDGDAGFADVEHSHPVLDHEAQAGDSSADFFGDFPELQFGHRSIGLVFHAAHRPIIVEIAHGAKEQRDGADTRRLCTR